MNCILKVTLTKSYGGQLCGLIDYFINSRIKKNIAKAQNSNKIRKCLKFNKLLYTEENARYRKSRSFEVSLFPSFYPVFLVHLLGEHLPVAGGPSSLEDGEPDR